MKLVEIESPFAGPTVEDIEKNIEYARACMSDCLHRGEAPLASHILYTQKGILDDTIPEERKLGMEAGKAWSKLAELVVVYTDRGMSKGMKWGVAEAEKHGITVEYRSLPEWVDSNNS